jgi:ribosomal protein S18 acetylase RimI-like enzyme
LHKLQSRLPYALAAPSLEGNNLDNAAPRPLVEPLEAGAFDDFITYLNDHLTDNGGAAGYFQPMPRGQSALPAERAAPFRSGLAIAVGAIGWRRAWVARAADGQIVGHVDLRGHPESFTGHRCLLGMGVDRQHRRAGLGAALIAHARQWAAEVARLEWMDLQVMSQNRAALALYRRAGFATVGEIDDMFHIDGLAFSYTTMSMRLIYGT